MKITYDTSLIQYINLFESLTKAKIKDCLLYNEQLTFIVQEGNLKKALGQNNAKIKKLQYLVKKKLKVVEFSPKLEVFTLNLLYPLRPKSILLKDNALYIYTQGTKQKGLLIGRDSKNLTALKLALSRYFNIKDIRII